MGLHLYVGDKRKSSWSLRPYLALAHTGAPFELTTIWLDRPTTTAEIMKVSPTGRVPVLYDDALAIWDSLAICEYLAERFPAAGLWPADRAARARARSVSAEMHSGFAQLRTHMPMDLGASYPGAAAPPAGRAGRAPARLGPGVGHTPEALADARRVQAIWRDQLATSGGPFLFGAFTIADAMFAPVTTRFVTYGVELDDVCRRYVEAVAALPAMQAWTRDAAAEPA